MDRRLSASWFLDPRPRRITYLSNMIAACNLWSAVASNLGQIRVAVTIRALELLFWSIHLINNDTDRWILAQCRCSLRQLSIQQLLHLVLEPLGRFSTGVSNSRGNDELVMRKHRMLAMLLVTERTVDTILAPVWWREIDSFCKVELKEEKGTVFSS